MVSTLCPTGNRVGTRESLEGLVKVFGVEGRSERLEELQLPRCLPLLLVALRESAVRQHRLVPQVVDVPLDHLSLCRVRAGWGRGGVSSPVGPKEGWRKSDATVERGDGTVGERFGVPFARTPFVDCRDSDTQ